MLSYNRIIPETPGNQGVRDLTHVHGQDCVKLRRYQMHSGGYLGEITGMERLRGYFNERFSAEKGKN